MNVAFVLPAPVRVPQGGAAVVFRHAGGLVERGHRVDVIAPRRAPGVWPRVRRGLVRLRDAWHGVEGERPLGAPGVRLLEPTALREVALDAYDSVIATGHQTAQPVSVHAPGRGFYFLQGDERALSSRAEATWALPLVRFAVSTWVADLVRDHGHPVVGVVPNAVERADWRCAREPAERGAHVVALYHRHPVKGPRTLVQALRQLRELVPEVSATVVCARPPSHRLPRWVDVRVRPSPPELRAIYNQAAVCLHTSTVEGWGLVPMEAAACGCAVVATASRGPREYLAPGRSMVEVAVGDATALAHHAARLLEDSETRTAMATAAIQDVSRFSWDASTDVLESILTEHSA